jgi:hypothetical protein
MTKTDGSKYEAPRGVRLSDAANSRGESCFDGDSARGGSSCGNGNSDISCAPGNGANAHCDNGNSARGCLEGSNAAVGTGCVEGNSVLVL